MNPRGLHGHFRTSQIHLHAVPSLQMRILFTSQLPFLALLTRVALAVAVVATATTTTHPTMATAKNIESWEFP